MQELNFVLDTPNCDNGKNNLNSIGDLIKKERLLRGWSQKELAAKLELSEKQGRYIIKDYETRALYPPPELSMNLANLFKTRLKYFYDEYYNFLDKNTDEILKCWRNKKSISVEKAAETFSVTKETWNRWENGGKMDRKNYEKFKLVLK